MLLKMVLTQIFVSEIHVYCLFFFNILHKLYISHLEPGLKNRKKKKKKKELLTYFIFSPICFDLPCFYQEKAEKNSFMPQH